MKFYISCLIEKCHRMARRVNFRGANNHEISIQSLEVKVYTMSPSIEQLEPIVKSLSKFLR